MRFYIFFHGLQHFLLQYEIQIDIIGWMQAKMYFDQKNWEKIAIIDCKYKYTEAISHHNNFKMLT